MRSSRLLSLAAVTALASMGMSAAAPSHELQARPGSSADRTMPARSNGAAGVAELQAMRAMFGGRGFGRRRNPGPGWTHAQVQRMARKKRNQARNRRAHR